MAKTENKGKGPETNVPLMENLLLADISKSKLNPRKDINQDEIIELSESIFKIGVIQAIVVRPLKGKPRKYELVCGERRYLASILVNTAHKERNTIPAIIRDLTDAEAMELMITENLQRKDVHPIEEANAFQFMMDKMNYQIIDIGAKIGKNEAFVVRRLQLLKLIKELKDIFRKEELSIGHAELLSRVAEQDQLIWFTNTFKGYNGGQGTIKNLRSWLSNNTEHQLKKAAFKTDAIFEGKQFVCGRCTVCPQNSAFNNTLFPDTADDAICHNSHCFEAKTEAAFQVLLKKALDNPDMALINESYGENALATQLKKDGYTILKKYDDYKKLEKPVRAKYYTNDTEETIDARHAVNMAQYELEKKNALKAFNIAGPDRGCIYTIVLKSKNAGDLSKGNPRQTLIDDVAQKRKRGIELDREKIMKRLVEKMRPIYTEITSPELSKTEMDCLITLAFDNNGGGDEIKKLIGLGKNFYSYNEGPKLVDAISNASPEARAMIIRKAIFSHYTSINPTGMSGGILFHLAKDWCPDDLNGFIEDQNGVRSRREAKLDQKIKEFDKQQQQKEEIPAEV